MNKKQENCRVRDSEIEMTTLHVEQEWKTAALYYVCIFISYQECCQYRPQCIVKASPNGDKNNK